MEIITRAGLLKLRLDIQNQYATIEAEKELINEMLRLDIQNQYATIHIVP